VLWVVAVLISDIETTYRECMAKPRRWLEWEAAQARDWIAVPQATDDKYSRGVLGMRTGSTGYPGAAVLGVEAASRTGVGMLRYLGPRRVSTLVLQRRPEIVTADGRVQAWLLGSGMDAGARSAQTTAHLEEALRQGLPTVLDAGALDLVGTGAGATVITPHYRELAALLSRTGETVPAERIAADPGAWAIRTAGLLGVTVLLKGNTTHIASPSGIRLTVSGAPAWLATAGSGDVLAGILGALLATHSTRIEADADAVAALAATAAFVHATAADRASAGGPIVALDIAQAVPATIAALFA
jgi:NAD(P)H-hydrate repair Nnr-like enzyme with NAD(P)H-hydrate dehydratase domain